MRFKKLVSIVAVSGSLAMLAACSAPGNGSHGQNGNGAGGYGAGGAGGAQSSGLGENANFSDENNARGGVAQRTYYFDFDSSVVRDEYKPAIYANANYLLAHTNAKVIIEGHTDPRGSREYNIALGERRANAVAELLTSRGVGPAQIRVVSYGDERPAASGRTEQDFQKDRRAVIVKTQG